VTLVDKHIAYAQFERAAGLASGDRAEVARWLSERLERAAYLLYAKRHTLLSVFMLPRQASSSPLADTAICRGHD
jgi:hypothetical protein